MKTKTKQKTKNDKKKTEGLDVFRFLKHIISFSLFLYKTYGLEKLGLVDRN